MTLCPPRAALRGSVLVLLAAICAGLRAQVQTDIIGFGHQSFDSSLDGRHDVAQVQTTSFATYLLLTNGDIRWVGQPTGYGLPPAPTGNPYVRIAFSNDHQLGLRSDGTVEMESPPPGGPVVLDPVPPLPPGVSYVEIDAGGQQALARRSDGAVVAFGAVLGTVPPLPAGTTYVQVDAGWFHAAAVRSDGQLVAWGDNSAGQCNVLPLPAGRTYVEVACGGHHTLARRSDGSVVAWGNNAQGQCNVPPLPAGLTYVEIDCGDMTSLARRSDGSVVAWGVTANGQAAVPLLQPGVSYVQLAASDNHMAALRSDGTFAAWGANDASQCNSPALPAGTSYVAVDADSDAAAALRSDGAIVVWGQDHSGTRLVPALPPATTYTKVSTAVGRVAAARSDGALLRWGTAGPVTVPPSAGGMPFVKVAAGVRSHALRVDGVVVAIEPPNTPGTIPPPPAGRRYVDVACHVYYSVGLLDDGSVVAVDADGDPFAIPPLAAGLRYVEVETYYNVVVLRRSDGVVLSTNGSSTFTQPPPPAGTSYAQVSGYGVGYARLSDGSLLLPAGYPVPPTPPGTAFVTMDFDAILAGLVGPPTTYVRFALGCAGTRPAARLVPVDTPRLGAAFRVNVFDLPQNAAVMLTGFSNASSAFGPLPFDATPLGLPGCALASSADLVDLLLGANATAEYVVVIPVNPALVGLQFFQQALVPDAAANTFGAVLSAAFAGTIGG